MRNVTLSALLLIFVIGGCSEGPMVGIEEPSNTSYNDLDETQRRALVQELFAAAQELLEVDRSNKIVITILLDDLTTLHATVIVNDPDGTRYYEFQKVQNIWQARLLTESDPIVQASKSASVVSETTMGDVFSKSDFTDLIDEI